LSILKHYAWSELTQTENVDIRRATTLVFRTVHPKLLGTTWTRTPDYVRLQGNALPGQGFPSDLERYRRALRKELVAYLRNPDRGLIRLTDAGVTIGRDPANDVILEEDKLVSRSHAEVVVHSEQWYLVDLGSRNGTIVNGRSAHRHPLRDGDIIGIGSARFEFVLESDPHDTEVAVIISRDELASLTERERDVLRLISEGLTDKVIAERLYISPNTVRSHLERVREKTGLRRRSELTRLAMEQGLDDQGNPPAR
jgi:DNA-binding CsgD family transcriptional regulator